MCWRGRRSAFNTPAHVVMQVEVLEYADVAGRPHDLLVEAGSPFAAAIRAPPLEDFEVDHVQLVLHPSPGCAWAVGYAAFLHPWRAIATGGPAAADAEERFVAPLEVMRPVNAMPWVAGGDVDGSEVILYRETSEPSQTPTWLG